MKPLYTIYKDVSVGIYNNCEYVARIYKDKIIVVSPYVNWVGNTGSLAEAKEAIRNQKVIDAVLLAMSDDCEADAWDAIGHALDDDYLRNY